VLLQPLVLDADAVATHILQRSWQERDLQVFLSIQRWRTEDVLRHIATPPPPTLPPATQGIFALRTRLGFFGHNAPPYASLQKAGVALPDNNWDTTPCTIWTDSSGSNAYVDADVFLERVVPQILRDSWVVFETPRPLQHVYRVSAVTEESLADYGLSARTTGLRLAEPDGTGLPPADQRPRDFLVRKTTAFVQSERLALADLPIDDPVGLAALSTVQPTPQGPAPYGLGAADGSNSLVLDHLVLGLQVGQPLILTGTRYDLPGVTGSEVVFLANIVHNGGFTLLRFAQSLQYSYVRSTVTLNANVVLATHGETVQEVLGSGDGTQASQRFQLKKPPLTYITAPTASGAQSTLQVQVNGVRWQEAPRLYDLDGQSESYLVRIDDGTTNVIFGDGEHGARLPSGTENVIALYRSGIGVSGLVAAGALTMLLTRPAGIRGVTNPLKASGAADPENRDEARENAPRTVLTLDRIVSLQDYEDFTRAFAGIGKAQAVALWQRPRYVVAITVAAADGDTVDSQSPLYMNLTAAIDAASDPSQPFHIDSYQPLFFNLAAQVAVDPSRAVADVLAAVTVTLRGAFSFTARAFVQAVTAAEVIKVIQGVTGVIAVDLQQLYLVTNATDVQQPALASILPAASGRLDDNHQIQPAQLLLLNPAGVTLTEMQV
jgi:hypothetical protein